MTEAAKDYGDVTRLKSLLFRPEQEALDDMRGLLDAHHERIGSDADMQRTVSTVLAGALRDARVRQHKQVADAIAPILVEGMKREIKNSRDEMVDALYPIMGRLVSAYVSSAVADMMNQTNQRLESGLTGRFLYLRAKAALTGKSYEEVAVQDRQMFQISELMLIRRGSGMLIDHLQLDLDDAVGADGPKQDSALVSGVVAAIHEFAQEAFSKKKASLRSVDMGEETIYLRATSGLILAVIGRGKARRKFERALDMELVSLLDDNSDDIERLGNSDTDAGPKILPAVAERLMRVQIEANQRKPILALLLVGLLATAIAGWAAWTAYDRWQTARLHSAVKLAIAAQPAFEGYPMEIDIAPDRSSVRVAGFAPSPDARDALVSSIDSAVGSTPVSSRLNVLPSVNGVEARLSDAERELTRVAGELRTTARRADLADLSENIKKLVEAEQLQRDQFQQRTQALQKRIAALEARPQPDFSKLGQWIQRNGIFFGDDTTYRSTTKARATIKELTALLKNDPARIRVIGYADVRGRPEDNSVLAQNRAERVVRDLVSAGIPSRRLIAVGRASERQFSTDTGPESGNRRVEFELLFDGE